MITIHYYSTVKKDELFPYLAQQYDHINFFSSFGVLARTIQPTERAVVVVRSPDSAELISTMQALKQFNTSSWCIALYESLSKDSILHECYKAGYSDVFAQPYSPEVFNFVLSKRVELLHEREDILNRPEQARVPINADGVIYDMNGMYFVESNGEINTLLTPQGKLFNLLLTANGDPVHRNDIMNAIWGYENVAFWKMVNSYVSRLRKIVNKYGFEIRCKAKQYYYLVLP